MVKELQIILSLLLLVGCSESPFNSESTNESNLILELYMNLPMTDDGYYIFDYPNNQPHTYTSVESISSPMERIFWGSDDFFCVEHMYHTFCEPIANYSTYTSVDSTSKRLVYIYQPHINDTLSGWGCIYGYDDDYLCKEVSFIVAE